VNLSDYFVIFYGIEEDNFWLQITSVVFPPFKLKQSKFKPVEFSFILDLMLSTTMTR